MWNMKSLFKMLIFGKFQVKDKSLLLTDKYCNRTCLSLYHEMQAHSVNRKWSIQNKHIFSANTLHKVKSFQNVNYWRWRNYPRKVCHTSIFNFSQTNFKATVDITVCCIHKLTSCSSSHSKRCHEIVRSLFLSLSPSCSTSNFNFFVKV